MKKRKVLSLIVIGALAASLAACGSSETETSSVDSADEEEEETSSLDADVDVTEAAETLYTLMKNYADTVDYDSFSALFTDTDDEDIEELYEQEYPVSSTAVNVVLIAEDDYSYVGITDYVVSGTFPDSLATVTNYTFALTIDEDNEWAFIVDEYIDDYIFTTEQIPEEMETAVEEEYNYAWFDSGNYMYMDDTLVYEGVADSRIKFAWQDEDGDLWLAVWLVNGTDSDLRFKKASELTLTDDELGDILALEDYTVGTTVSANSSELVLIEIDAEYVETGTETWSGSLTASMPINYKVVTEESSDDSDSEDSDSEDAEDEETIDEDDLDIEIEGLDEDEYEIEIEEE